eukprot:jgi/Botrbrau1/1677/Bobra.116_2s0021.1
MMLLSHLRLTLRRAALPTRHAPGLQAEGPAEPRGLQEGDGAVAGRARPASAPVGFSIW